MSILIFLHVWSCIHGHWLSGIQGASPLAKIKPGLHLHVFLTQTVAQIRLRSLQFGGHSEAQFVASEFAGHLTADKKNNKKKHLVTYKKFL